MMNADTPSPTPTPTHRSQLTHGAKLVKGVAETEGEASGVAETEGEASDVLLEDRQHRGKVRASTVKATISPFAFIPSRSACLLGWS